MVAGTGVSVAQYYQQGPPPPPPGYEQHGDWENTPPEFREVQQRGFHDGIEGARKDFGNHRPPDVNNRDEYRNPHVDRADRRAYREAFRRGYEVGVQHIYGRDRGPDRY
jgi:hypothetical protein